MKDLKKEFAARFKKLVKRKRLLAVQLNGFSHTVFYDNGKGSKIMLIDYYSNYADLTHNDWVKEFFDGIPNYVYQNNAQEIVYVMPEDR